MIYEILLFNRASFPDVIFFRQRSNIFFQTLFFSQLANDISYYRKTVLFPCSNRLRCSIKLCKFTFKIKYAFYFPNKRFPFLKKKILDMISLTYNKNPIFETFFFKCSILYFRPMDVSVSQFKYFNIFMKITFLSVFQIKKNIKINGYI